jgi:anti-anti-sigma factor
MQYTLEATDSDISVVLTESFTFRDNGTFREMLGEIEKHHFSRISCDVSAIDFVDSAALGMLLLLRDMAEKKHSDVVLRGARGQVQKMFEVSKFSKLFIIE